MYPLETGVKKNPRRLSILVIPDSDHRVRNIRLPLIVMLGLVGALVLVTVFLILRVSSFSIQRQNLSRLNSGVEESGEQMDRILDSLDQLKQAYGQWESALERTLSELDLESPAQTGGYAADGDLASLEDVQEIGADEIRQIHDVKRMTQILNESRKPLAELARVLNTQKESLADFPNLWPVSGGHSVISLEFGLARNPYTGKQGVHRGIDIAGLPGMLVVSSANGKVISAGFDQGDGLGAYVLVQHKLGIKTRYSHLGTCMVHPGDELSQGQALGTIGISGDSPRPNVTFEILIGTQFIDPASFLINLNKEG